MMRGKLFFVSALEKEVDRTVFYWSFKDTIGMAISIGFAWLKRGMRWRKIFVRVITKNGREPVLHMRIIKPGVRITGVRPGKLFFDGFF